MGVTKWIFSIKNRRFRQHRYSVTEYAYTATENTISRYPVITRWLAIKVTTVVEEGGWIKFGIFTIKQDALLEVNSKLMKYVRKIPNILPKRCFELYRIINDFFFSQGCQDYGLKHCGRFPKKYPCSAPVAFTPRCIKTKCTNEWYKYKEEKDIFKGKSIAYYVVNSLIIIHYYTINFQSTTTIKLATPS